MSTGFTTQEQQEYDDTTFKEQELQKYIDRVADRLPKKILVAGKELSLEIRYWESENHWTLSYGTNNPNDCFIHRDEATLETCVLGAWRNLALKKDEWEEAPNA